MRGLGFRSGKMRRVKRSYVKDCLESLKKFGIMAWATKSTTFIAYLVENGEPNPTTFFHSGIVGQGDITGVLPDGRRLEIACLKPRQGNPGDRRMSFLNKINKLGGVGIYVNSVQHMDELLQELGYTKKEGKTEDVGEEESGSGLCPPKPQANGVDSREIREGGPGNPPSGDSGSV